MLTTKIELESKQILHRLGFSEVSNADMGAVRKSWNGVLHRTDYWARFWGEFCLAGEPEPNPLRRFIRNFFRSFTVLYFFSLIRTTVFMRRPPEPENYGDQFMAWEHRFAEMDGAFLGGDEPDSVDLLLFGIIQCHCSVPVPPLYALQADPRLILTRRWIGQMQQYFSDYPSLYSGVYFEPHSPPPKPANAADQVAFWIGGIVMVAFFWIALPLIAVLAYRNRIRRHAI